MGGNAKGFGWRKERMGVETMRIMKKKSGIMKEQQNNNENNVRSCKENDNLACARRRCTDDEKEMHYIGRRKRPAISKIN